MVIDKFSGKLVFLDTAPLIYFIEGHSPQGHPETKQKKQSSLRVFIKKNEMIRISLQFKR